MRFIPLDVPTLEQLGAPRACSRSGEKDRGLVLCVGAAGNGKSTTLAAMIDHMNRNASRHIVTIEDPIEYMHEDERSSISQREIGFDTTSFASALRAALRQDPDVIQVGEIRDAETMDIALKAAETGHLVLSTLHTPDVFRTVNRMICAERRASAKSCASASATRSRASSRSACCPRRRPGDGARRRGAGRDGLGARDHQAPARQPAAEGADGGRHCIRTGCRPSRCTSKG